MNRKKLIVLSLIVSSLLIWSHNLYRIFLGIKQSNEEIVEGSPLPRSESQKTVRIPTGEDRHFVYSGMSRDPFKHWLQQPKKTAPPPDIHRSKEQEAKLLLFRFSGVMRDSAGILAVIEGPGDAIYFAREKDTIEGISVLGITDSHVECQFQNTKFQLPLKPK